MDKNEVLVKKGQVEECVCEILNAPILAVDTETTGFNSFKGASLFSIIVASEKTSYYFNFNWYTELGLEEYILGDEAKSWLRVLFERPRLWILQNAKFDLHMLMKEDMLPQGEYYDTQVAGRIINNILPSYSLDSLSEAYLNQRKDDRVVQWLEENKCYSMVPLPGRKKMEKNYHYDQVPFELISTYALKDARLTYDLYLKQQEYLLDSDQRVLENEMRLIKTLYDMEQVGVQVDLEYVKEASSFEESRIKQYQGEWLSLIGGELVDSGEYLKPVFEGLGYEIPWTDKMEPNVDADVVATIEHPSARILESYRDAEKRYTTLKGIESAADNRGVVHTSFKQSGTVTGRMSSANPNLQNLSADDESRYPIRRSFVPRPGFFFVSIDYQQMEFRLLLEYANEVDLIEQIKNGHDPHDSTAELTGLPRKAAKTLNFGLVYGMGIKRLAKAIGVTDAEAKRFKAQYFSKLPGVRVFLWEAAKNQENRGFTWNWYGRRFQLREKKFSYRAPNSIIQGGCADVCKIAMNKLHDLLADKKTRMLLQVHDEILFEVAFEEMEIIPQLKLIMEKAYPYRNMPLTCSVSYSLKSFHDQIEVDDVGDIFDAARAYIPSQGSKGVKEAQEHMVL